VVNAYTLSFGGLLLLGGRVGDVLGRRRAFIGGVALFALGSLLGGLAPNGGWLLGMRVWESFIDCMHGNVDKDTLARLLAENVVLNSPFSDEPLTGREAVMEAIQTVHRLTTDLTYKEVLSGETHHAAFFRLQIEDTVVNGMDYALLDADGKVAEVTIWWRPLPSAVEMQGHLAHALGMQPWELRTNGE
jgi:hypothetical protein